MDSSGHGQIPAAAVAFESLSTCEQVPKRITVECFTAALVFHRAVVEEAKCRKGVELPGGGARLLPRWIDVLDPQQPFRTGLARDQPAAQRGQQGTGVQWAAR